MRRWGFLGAIALVFCACDGPTQLLVVVDSDLGDRLVSVEASASSDALLSSQRFEIASTGLPFSFGVARTDERIRDVQITVTGFSDDDALVTYTMETSFEEGRNIRVDVPLARACQTEPSCTELGQRCEFGTCLDVRIEPASLPDATGDTPGLFDGATQLPDAGGFDAMPDCVTGNECSAPTNPCMTGLLECDGDGPRCVITETLPEGAPCGEGRSCNGMGICG